MKFPKLSLVATACVLVVGCGGSSQTDEVASADGAVAQEQFERMDEAERATTTAPATVSGGSKPSAVRRTVTCANGSRIDQAAGYYASGSNWVLGSFMPRCPTGVAAVAPAPAPVAAPVASPAPAPAAAPVAAPAPAPVAAVTAPVTAVTSVVATVPAVVAAVTAAATTAVNAALLPVAVAGANARRINNTGEMPYRDPDGMGAFRTVCGYSHMNFDDPLVYPGQPGRAHLHVFFGNTGVNANSTPESIRNSGNGTCRGGTVNRSAYWVPAMIDASGRPVRPRDDNDIYYKTGYSLFGQNSQVNAFPVGFRMIALDSKSRVPQSKAHFECNGAQTSTIPNCPNGELRQVISFPQCWDGVNLDSPDHRSHVVYASGGSCPASHPVHFPEISMIVKYSVPASGSAGWRLSSDINGTPAGSSSHGDWMNGWEQEVMNTFITRVVRQGLSGGSHIIGDGRTIY